jgi:hypothetical protein
LHTHLYISFLCQANAAVDLVTAVDKACEDQIIGLLRARYPEHGAPLPSLPRQIHPLPPFFHL